jgi:peroxiredoxin
MAAKNSTMLALGTEAPHFSLPDFNGKIHNLSDFKFAKGLVVAFICNHCPFVKHVRTEFARFARDYQSKGIAVVAINSNDIQSYPQDGPAGMKEESQSAGYIFPYLLDETQSVAKAYRAACTPDFYLFDAEFSLAYRGQFDSSRPGNGQSVTGMDLRTAATALFEGSVINTDQLPSIGCNIKWRSGNEPDYA